MAQGSNYAICVIAVFPVHIQYFYNLPQAKRSLPRSLFTFAENETPIDQEIIVSNYLELSLISRASTNNVIQNELTGAFLHFLSLDLDTIVFYTDGSLAENKSSGSMDMGSGWISLNGGQEFCCKIFSWPSSTRAELLAIYTALLTVPCNRSVIIKTDSQAAIDGIYKSSGFTNNFQWTNVT